MQTEEPAAVQAMCDQYQDWIYNERRLALSKPKSIYMHCMPIDRGYEVTNAVADSSHSVIYDEAENRLHVQKGLMALTMGGRI
jgi:N-acetylornithine carbamoyltransferase